jgi:hypothetical protein
LRGHVGGFIGGTTKHNEEFGEFGNFHTAFLPQTNAVSRNNLN